MKTKSFHKKLTLNKKTVANMKNSELKVVYGGIPNTRTQVSVNTACCGCILTPPPIC